MRMVNWLRVGNLVLLLVNIALFALWFSLIRKDALPPGGGAAEYVLSQVSLQVTVLSVMVALGAILLAGLGFFGFQALLERAQSTADKTARETATRLFRELKNDPVSAAVSMVNRGPQPDTTASEDEARL